MSEQVCICGHNHVWPPDCGYTPSIMCQTDGCTCRKFRPSLPWPDAEGWWWCDNGNERRIGISKAVNNPSRGLMFSAFTRSEFELEFGHARFTKLLETNPYDSTP